MEQLRLQVRDLNTKSQLTKVENEAEITELKSKAGAFETQLAKEREANKKLMVDNQDLQTELSKTAALTGTNSKLRSDIAEKDTAIQMKDASSKRKDSELEAKSRALEEKDTTISAMSEQLTKTREYLATKQQVSTKTITDYS